MARSRLGRSQVRGWLAFSAAAVLVLLVPVPQWAIEEFYSEDAYPFLQRGVTFISNLLPFAVIDLLIVVTAGLVVMRAFLIVRRARQEGALEALWEGTRRVMRATAVLLLVFMSFWGCHYRRTPLEASLQSVAAPTPAMLVAAVGDANTLAASLRPTMMGLGEISYEQTASALEAPMAAALSELRRPSLALAGRPKYSRILTPFFTWAGVNGMINPLALESIVHPDLLGVERPFVLAHEWAHLAGFADEAEASAVGWLACLRGGPSLAYSASLYLIMEAGAAMPASAWRKASGDLDPGVRKDIQAIIARMRQQQKPRVQRAAFKVYDGYLKANSVEDGTASYARALTLILSPQLRAALQGYGGGAPKS